MRLTLRALLAYMDGLLGPEDAEDIGKKIEENDTVRQVYHRLRDAMRKVRLAAPSPTERGPWLDPNTVAEYLDNALPADRVPDFEKVCLDSDMQLAEVGACHQILALVLGEPAVIEPGSRERMYDLPNVAAQAKTGEPVAPLAAGAGDGAAAGHKARPKPTVPEYLREPRRPSRLMPIAALLLLAGCLVGLVLLATGQFDPEKPLGRTVRQWFGGIDLAQNPEAAEMPASDKTESAALQEKSGEDSSEDGKTAAAPPTDPVAEKTAIPKPAIPKPAPAEENPLRAQEDPVPPAENVGPALSKGEEPAGKLPPDELAKADPKLPPVPEAKPVPDPDVKILPGPGNKPAIDPGVKPVVPEPGAAAARQGKFISDRQEVLAKLEPETAVWQRVPTDGFILGGEQLIALPAFRPRLALSSGATLELLGGTRVQVLPEDRQNPSGISVIYGRVVLKPLAHAGVRVQLGTGNVLGTLTLAEAESVAAIEVARIHAPGTNPETAMAQVAASLYVVRGDVLWEEGGGKKPVQLTGPTRLPLTEAGSSPALGLNGKDMPKWIVAEPVNPLEPGASAILADALQAGRSATLGLMEAAEHRRQEVRWLAVRCLGHLGQFDTMAAALNDLARKREWSDYIEQLRAGVALGPDTARAIRQALEKQFGPNASALYRMLWGYSDQDLQTGQDAKLVSNLEHETLAFRVLASWTLKDLTGLGLFFYPEAPAAKRQQSVARWKQRLQEGKIRTKVGSLPAVEPPLGDKEKAEPPLGEPPPETTEPPVKPARDPVPPPRPVVPEPEELE